jgi:hypothetical protein
VAIKNTSNKLKKFTFNVEQKSKQPPQPVGCVIILVFNFFMFLKNRIYQKFFLFYMFDGSKEIFVPKKAKPVKSN